jgi:hypothetical protein
MRFRKVGFLCLGAVITLAGCASRLGYPAKTIGIPTPVTLVSHVASKGTLFINLPYMARDMWSSLYQKRSQNILDNVSNEKLQRQLSIVYSKNVGKSTDLFTVSSSEVIDTGSDYQKAKTDPPAYSGFDFASLKDSIPTQYVLVLSIDEWGRVVAQNNSDNGVSISLRMQLVDKDTNMAVWSYHYDFRQQVNKDAYELITVSPFEDLLTGLTKLSVDQLFNWLGR